MGLLAMNKLYFGDNLDVLRKFVTDESVDLIYLDPPFNSQAQYNVLFRSPKEDSATAQAQAFLDTWTWGEEAEWAFKEVMKRGGGTARFIDALRSALKESDMMAYLVMMAVRLSELQRVLKDTGNIFLHCDLTAKHYLKILLDGIFEPQNFRNEITWVRTTAGKPVTKNLPKNADYILWYAKSEKSVFNQISSPLTEADQETFTKDDDDGRGPYNTQPIINPAFRPNLQYTYKDAKGRKWPSPPKGWRFNEDRMKQLEADNRLVFGASIREKYYLRERQAKGKQMSNIWIDISGNTVASSNETMGYPTQKPLALLDRIISMASQPGDIILDPFCGCGTTIEAAEKSKREWVGIDIAIHAVKVIEARLDRLEKTTGKKVRFESEGMPKDFASAVKLAERDKYQFQWWANYLFNPHALREQKKGADRGVDGELFFPNGPGRPWGRMLTSVKGGEQVGPSMVRDFARVLEREEAQLGLFICLYPPTREMAREAASVGFADIVHGDIPRLQIVALEEWFKGKTPILPPLEHLPTAAFAGRRHASPVAPKPDAAQPELPLSFKGGKSIERHFNLRMVTSDIGKAKTA